MTSAIQRRHILGAGAAATAGLLSAKARADEAPAQPQSPPPPIEAYAASPLVDQVALSPDGKTVAVVSQDGDDKILISFSASGGEAKKVAIGNVKVRDLFFGDNNHVVLVNSQVAVLHEFVGFKHEFSQARVIGLDDLKVTTLYDHMDSFYNIVLGDLSRIKVDGEYRVTASNFRIGGGFGLCLYSFSMKSSWGHEIFEATKDAQGFVFTPNGQVVAYSEFEDERKLWTLYYNTAAPGKSSSMKAIYKVKDTDLSDGANFPSLEGLGRDGKSVVVYVTTADGEGQYHEISAEGVLSEPLDTDEARSKTSSALFHPTTWQLCGFRRHDDWFKDGYSDPLMKKLADALPVIMGEDYRAKIVSYAEDPRKMIIYGESPTDAGTYYFADLSVGNLIQIAQNYELLPTEWITQKKAISYKAADGLTIHGYLTLPPFRDPKNLPLVVLPHGGPWARDFIDYDWQSQVLASRGYAVLQPNFRGSTGYTKDFEAAGNGEMGRKMQTDLSDGVRYLASLGTVDPKRVTILGASYGGYAALAGATLDPGIYRCAVSIAGLSDVKSWINWLSTNYVEGHESTGVLGWTTFLGDKSRWDAISPARQAANASCPVLLIHGTDDTVVPIEQSRRMENALKAAGKPVEFVTYKGQDHWETIGSARIEMMKAAMAFLDKHNPAG